MIATHKEKPHTSERGVALVLAILVLLVVSTIVAGMIIMASSETNTSANFRDEQASFFASRAGLEEVRDRLRTTATNSITPPSTLPGTNNGILYITNPLAGETVAPWNTAGSDYPDNEICVEVACTGGVPAGSPWYTAASASTTYAASPKLAWKWVRLAPKLNRSATTTRTTSVDGTTNGQRVCWNGTNEVVIANTFASCQAASASFFPVYTLTSLASTAPIPPATSGSRRMTQYEVTPASFPPMPGAMVFDGPSTTSTYSHPNSNAFAVSGTDQNLGPNNGAGCSATPVNQPAIGAIDTTSASNVLTSLQGNPDRSASYTSSSPYPTSGSVVSVNSSLSAHPRMNLTTADGLTKFVKMITDAAGSSNVYGSNPTIANMGTSSAPVINVVNGDLTLGGGSSGAGILLVTGTLTMSGNPSYNGLILVVGKGNVVKNGGGNGVLNGSLFVANLYTDTNYTTKIPLGASPNNPPGPPSIAWGGGGNATIQYDSCWINFVIGGAFPLEIVSMRELIYR
jgi:Tfp pilus assembly protein PilX